MKRKTIALLASFFLVLLINFGTYATSADSPKDDAPTTIKKEKKNEAEAQLLTARLEEIKAMDKSTMTTSEKRALRKEVRALRSQLAQIGGGIYISAGALIVILLLILLL